MNRTLIRGKVLLVKLPDNKLKGLAEIKKKLSLNISISKLAKVTENLPYTVIDKIMNTQFERLIMESGLSEYLEFVPQEVVDYSFAAWSAYKDKAENKEPIWAEPAEDTLEEDELDPQHLLNIAQMVSNENPEVMNEISHCAFHPTEYFEAHQDQYEEWGITKPNNIYSIWLLGLVDLLIEHQHACELDWKEEKEDFLFSIQDLTAVKKNGLTILPEWFSEDGEITEWCSILADNWRTEEICLAALDIDSDSYVLFPYPSAKLPMLIECAEKIGFKIDLAENL